MTMFILLVVVTLVVLTLIFGGAVLVRRWIDRRDLKPLLGVASPPEPEVQGK